jgi:hypothetical protein
MLGAGKKNTLPTILAEFGVRLIPRLARFVLQVTKPLFVFMALHAHSAYSAHRNSSQNISVGRTNHSLMKKALWSMLEFFVGHNRREKTNPVHREYCICGAPKPEEGRRRKREPSFKTESRLHRI